MKLGLWKYCNADRKLKNLDSIIKKTLRKWLNDLIFGMFREITDTRTHDESLQNVFFFFPKSNDSNSNPLGWGRSFPWKSESSYFANTTYLSNSFQQPGQGWYSTFVIIHLAQVLAKGGEWNWWIGLLLSGPSRERVLLFRGHTEPPSNPLGLDCLCPLSALSYLS